MVSEVHILEFDLAPAKSDGLCAWRVAWRSMLRLKVEGNFHVEKALAYFAVDGAEEVEGHRKLEYELIDHDELADGHRAYAAG